MWLGIRIGVGLAFTGVASVGYIFIKCLTKAGRSVRRWSVLGDVSGNDARGTTNVQVESRSNILAGRKSSFLKRSNN